jgi:hypothetical protein
MTEIQDELNEVMETIRAIQYRYNSSPRFRVYVHDEPSIENVTSGQTSKELLALQLILQRLKERAALLELELTP